MTTTFRDGAQVEVGMFGYESISRRLRANGNQAQSEPRYYTQIAGCGYSSPLEASRAEFALGGLFQKLRIAAMSRPS